MWSPRIIDRFVRYRFKIELEAPCIAKKMLKQNLDIKMIAEITGLSKEEIKEFSSKDL